MDALVGIRVLDFSRVLAGPFCSMMLADLGADVIKIERPGTGDETRQWGPPFVVPGLSAYFASVNRNKRSVTLDLGQPAGTAVARELALHADVVIENFKPGVMDRLELGYDALKASNPRLVFCSISGFGPDGPYRERAGYDLVVSALGGLMWITGEADRAPVKVGVALTDVCTGLAAHGSICAALVARTRAGTGQRIDLSLLETQVAALVNVASSFLVSGREAQRWGTAHETIVPYQAFDAADGHLVVAVGNDSTWRKFCDAIGQQGLGRDPRFLTNPLRVENREACIAAVAPLIRARPRGEWLAAFEKAGVPAAPINALEDVFRDPQVLHRGMVVEMAAPDGTSFKAVGLPVKFSGTPARIRRRPPLLGEHTEEVLAALLGYDEGRIRDLRASGVI
ncbi:MAG: CaiB/BaiF CoA transferase family protein [Vicinamibacterales bacterium]